MKSHLSFTFSKGYIGSVYTKLKFVRIFLK